LQVEQPGFDCCRIRGAGIIVFQAAPADVAAALHAFEVIWSTAS
jgi:hypothetical protein